MTRGCPRAGALADELETDAEHVLEARAAARAHSPASLDPPLTDETGGTIADLVPAREDTSEHADTRVIAQHLLGRLSPRNRAVLLLRYHEDLKQHEIGECQLAGEPARSVASGVEPAGTGALSALLRAPGRGLGVVCAVVAVVNHHAFGAVIVRARLRGALGVGRIGVL